MVRRVSCGEHHGGLTGPYNYLLYHASNRDKIQKGSLRRSPLYPRENALTCPPLLDNNAKSCPKSNGILVRGAYFIRNKMHKKQRALFHVPRDRKSKGSTSELALIVELSESE